MQAIDTLIRQAITGNSDLATMVGSRVHLLFAPDGTSMPYLVITPSGGGEEIDIQLEALDLSYAVKVVTDDAQEAQSGAQYIREAFRETDLGSHSGWTVYRSQTLGRIFFVEFDERRRIYNAGFNIRVRASK